MVRREPIDTRHDGIFSIWTHWEVQHEDGKNSKLTEIERMQIEKFPHHNMDNFKEGKLPLQDIEIIRKNDNAF